MLNIIYIVVKLCIYLQVTSGHFGLWLSPTVPFTLKICPLNIALSLCHCVYQDKNSEELYRLLLLTYSFWEWQRRDTCLFPVFALDFTLDMLLCYHNKCYGNHLLRTSENTMHIRIPHSMKHTLWNWHIFSKYYYFFYHVSLIIWIFLGTTAKPCIYLLLRFCFT